ncbi:uracil dna n-glycosylase [Moniliophthora roreri MCA 2997]|uniref:Uracil-DNA glycosylase n=1 Tax=Moniliophthora roreri (strain MCA 2997) TaxID=1381753 RepID=V2YKW6_MONRO|nr:uracil dna n-glycosylase [Moniliophthora roreri MCA 2997]KAI3613797.1 uracil dna n-glycosylase [Moniliophthora roreri]
MSSSEEVVYLEDLEGPEETSTELPLPASSSQITMSQSTTTVTPESSQDVKQKTSSKRQITLTDMFGANPSSKRAKISPQSSTASLKSITATTRLGSQKLNSIPFSMKAFRESLTEEQQNLLNLECQVMGKSWLKVLQGEIKKSYFLDLKRFLWEQGVRGVDDSDPSLKVYPAPRNIYTWSNTPLGKVKVVLIGQDPYHNRGQAHGLCFSVPPGVAPPPSLKNIYAELKTEYPEFEPPKHGNLMSWASNGVLMLNTCLTVKANTPGSHSGHGWETFTDKVVDIVDQYGGANLPSLVGSEGSGFGRGVVFMAWGAFAEKRVTKLNKTKHLVLTSAHPSPYSAHKGFFGNGHFRKANEWLERRYGPEGKVDWCRLECEPSGV